jgi:hypothetical protein
MTPSKSMPRAGYRSLVLHMTEARVATGSPQVNAVPAPDQQGIACSLHHDCRFDS